MNPEEQLVQEQEKRKALYESIKDAKTNDELDKIELDIRKADSKIKDLKEIISSSDPAARNLSNDYEVGFNPMNTYSTGNEQRGDKLITLGSYRSSQAQVGNNIIDKNTTNNVFLRNNESILSKTNIPQQERGLNIGKYIRGVVTGQWEGADSEKRAMLTSGTGTIIPCELSGNIIDVARNKSLFTLSGVPTIAMTTDNIKIARVKNDPSFKFKEEGKEATENSFELESIDLRSKTCYGYAYVSLEAIKSSKNLDSIITNTFSSAISEAIDKGMLYGQYNDTDSKYDAFAPSGVFNDENINTVDATSFTGYDPFIKAIGKVRKYNGVASVYGINANTEESLSLLKDKNGQYLTPPKAITDINQIVSNQLKSDDENGDESLVFDPNSMVIGIQNYVSIQMFNNTDECIKKGLVAFRIYAMLDCVVTQPKHICKIENINKATA